jgi:hypothetical protein
MSPHFYYLSCDQSSFYKPPFRISISLWPSGPFLHSALNSIISSGSDQGLDTTMAEKVCAWMDVEILIYFLLLLFLVSIYLLFSAHSSGFLFFLCGGPCFWPYGPHLLFHYLYWSISFHVRKCSSPFNILLGLECPCFYVLVLQKVTIMVIKVDLECEKCHKKIKKVLCRIPRECLFLHVL